MTTHTMTVTVPVTVQLFDLPGKTFDGFSLHSESNVSELRGIGNIKPSKDGKGWDVFFRCNDEHPLEGFAFDRNNCVAMVRKHLRMIALNMQEDA